MNLHNFLTGIRQTDKVVISSSLLCSIFIVIRPSRINTSRSGADLEGGVRGVRPPKIRKAYVIQR
jgi:hypothetical protein